MEVTDFTLLTRITQRKGQSGRKLFPPAGLQKESYACLSGDSDCIDQGPVSRNLLKDFLMLLNSYPLLKVVGLP